MDKFLDVFLFGTVREEVVAAEQCIARPLRSPDETDAAGRRLKGTRGREREE
jgi:hypothetical protein